MSWAGNSDTKVNRSSTSQHLTHIGSQNLMTLAKGCWPPARVPPT